MRRKLTRFSFYCLLIAVALYLSSALSLIYARHKVPLIGKWHVDANSSNLEATDHTYEFLPNGKCIEQYRAEQMAGTPDEPGGLVTMQTVITYKYRYLGGQRYRLYPITSLTDGNPTHWTPLWRIIDATITGNEANVYVAAQQHSQALEMAVEAAELVEKSSNGRNNPNPSKPATETWIRIS